MLCEREGYYYYITPLWGVVNKGVFYSIEDSAKKKNM